MTKRGKIDKFSFVEILNLNKSNPESKKSAIYNNHILVAHDIQMDDIPKDAYFLHTPTRMNLFMMVLCLDGEISIQCDMQECHIRKNSLFICKPDSIMSVTSGKMKRSSLMISDFAMQEELNISFQRLLPHYSELEKLFVIQLTNEECKLINSMLSNLKELIQNGSGHLYYHDTVRAQISAVTYQFLNLFSKGVPQTLLSKQMTNRHEEYFRKFIHLLGIHFRQQRRVSFYSEQMNISAKYLGSIIHSYTGRTVSNWIDKYVIAEAKTLLRNTNLGIQEISYELNFPNQSFFGKYFKTHTGKSPSEFRKTF